MLRISLKDKESQLRGRQIDAPTIILCSAYTSSVLPSAIHLFPAETATLLSLRVISPNRGISSEGKAFNARAYPDYL